MGAQNALYPIAQLLAGPKTTVGVEDPPRNYFRLGFSSIPAEKITPGI